MKIRECIDKLDGLKPNQYSEELKVEWLSALDAKINADIIQTHELLAGEPAVDYRPYTINDMGKNLIAKFPYDELYVAYLKMKIDEENQETARYNNSAILFNSYYSDYEKSYNRTHKRNHSTKYHIW